jgi:FG-GAP-like repeat
MMGRDTSQPGFRIADPARTPYALTAGDLNKDGSPDIVLGYTSGPHSVFFNDGSGHTFTEVKFGDPKGSAYGFALGDVNGDTFLDIALARSGAPNVLYLSGK